MAGPGMLVVEADMQPPEPGAKGPPAEGRFFLVEQAAGGMLQLMGGDQVGGRAGLGRGGGGGRASLRAASTAWRPMLGGAVPHPLLRGPCMLSAGHAARRQQPKGCSPLRRCCSWRGRRDWRC